MVFENPPRPPVFGFVLSSLSAGTAMSLNSVVNKLVRAAAGIPFDISDSDLDRHVAELLAAEAKVKEKSWSQLGLSAFLGEGRDSCVPWPSFLQLTLMVRIVDPIPTCRDRTNGS